MNNSSIKNQNNISDINNNTSKSNINEIYRDNTVITEKDVLTNLKIISNLKPSEKLTHQNNILIIDPPSMSQGIGRWWNSDSRDQSILLIEKIIETAFELIDNIYTSEVDSSQNDNDKNNYYAKRIMPKTYFKNENSMQLQTYSMELSNSIKGLQNLKLTYLSDISICSKIDVLIEKINIRKNKISQLLTFSQVNTISKNK